MFYDNFAIGEAAASLSVGGHNNVSNRRLSRSPRPNTNTNNINRSQIQSDRPKTREAKNQNKKNQIKTQLRQ